MPYDVISALVRQQLQDSATWNVESFSVNGSDSHSTTYSMNQDLYVMIPDEATVQEAKEKLAALGNTVDGSTEAAEEPTLLPEPGNIIGKEGTGPCLRSG